MASTKNDTNRKKLELVRRAKSIPCADCNTVYPYYVMDMDHLPGFQKKFQLGQAVQYSLQAVAEEILKCEAVCANCHRVRTHTRGYKGLK